jgi:hypothetical protein
MKSSQADILRAIFERVSEKDENSGKAVFVAEEISRWPNGAVEALIRARLLMTGEPARSLVCHECEERCDRAIEISEFAGTNVAITTCHLNRDFGPFRHSLNRLNRWISTRQMVAKFVATQLGCRFPEPEGSDVRFRFGTLRIAGERRAVSLEFDGIAQLYIGGRRIDLDHLM